MVEPFLCRLNPAYCPDHGQDSQPVGEQDNEEYCRRYWQEHPSTLTTSRLCQVDEELVEDLHQRLPPTRHLPNAPRREPSDHDKHNNRKREHENCVDELVAADRCHELGWDLDYRHRPADESESESCPEGTA